VRLLKSVLMRVKNTKKPQQKFLCHVMRLMLLVPGRVTCRHLSRYRPYHENTFARWFERDVEFVSLNHAAIVEVVPPSHEHVLAFAPSCVPQSGKRTPGLDMFWNGAHSRAEKGLEMATLAWIEVTDNSASTLSVEQTSPAPHRGTEATRIDTYLAHSEHVVTTPQLHALKSLVADGYCSKQKFVDGICALEMHLISKLRPEAHRRHLDQGPRSTGPGRPKTDDGQVSYHELSRFEHVDTDDQDIALDHQVVNHPHLKRHLRLVVVQHFSTGR
jgi:DDE superfamily endonuclease